MWFIGLMVVVIVVLLIFFPQVTSTAIGMVCLPLLGLIILIFGIAAIMNAVRRSQSKPSAQIKARSSRGRQQVDTATKEYISQAGAVIKDKK